VGLDGLRSLLGFWGLSVWIALGLRSGFGSRLFALAVLLLLGLAVILLARSLFLLLGVGLGPAVVGCVSLGLALGARFRSLFEVEKFLRDVVIKSSLGDNDVGEELH